MSRDILVDFYSRPQLGGGFPVFKGTRRQVGGSFLSSLARFAIPILKFLGRKALGVAGNVASDVLTKNMTFQQSVPRRAREGLSETITDVRKQTGLGRKRKRPGKLVLTKRSRTTTEINTPPLPSDTIFS